MSSLILDRFEALSQSTESELFRNVLKFARPDLEELLLDTNAYVNGIKQMYKEKTHATRFRDLNPILRLHSTDPIRPTEQGLDSSMADSSL